MDSGSRFSVLDPQGRDEGDAEKAALYDPTAADELIGPCLRGRADWIRIALGILFGVPFRLVGRLLLSSARAARTLLGAAAFPADADDQAGPGPRGYAAPLRVALGVLRGLLRRLVCRPFVRFPPRAALLLLGAARANLHDLVGPPAGRLDWLWDAMELLLRVLRFLHGRLLRSSGRVAVLLLAATATSAVLVPSPVSTPLSTGGHGVFADGRSVFFPNVYDLDGVLRHQHRSITSIAVPQTGMTINHEPLPLQPPSGTSPMLLHNVPNLMNEPNTWNHLRRGTAVAVPWKTQDGWSLRIYMLFVFLVGLAALLMVLAKKIGNLV